MHPTFRIVALTAALAALSPVGFAAQVPLPLDFDRFSTVTQPVELDLLQGLQFSGAYGYGVSMLVNDPVKGDPENLGFVSNVDGKGGFLLNKSRTGDELDIIISLPQSSTARTTGPAVFFEAITFTLFTKGIGTSNQLFATGIKGEDGGRETTSGGVDLWSSAQTYTFSLSQQVTSLRFTAAGAAFALDDMTVTLSDPVDGSVPEPASFGLVGLALLGAGAASRRKQRG